MKKVLVLIPLLWTLCLIPFYKAVANDPNDHLNLSLTKTVSIKKYGNLKVYYEPYTVKEGEWLWRILADRYKIPLDQRSNLLHVLKKLNPTIPNTNKVYPGQKILIPLKLETSETSFAPTSPQPPSVSIKEHTVQPGESLSSIFLHDVYKVPGHLAFNEYTKLFHKLNPTIKDPNLLKVRQRILVPVYEPISKKEHKSAKERAAKPSIAEETNIEKNPSFPSGANDKAAPIEIEKTIPLLTESGTKGIKDFIGTVFKNTGDHYIDKGNYYIPIPGRGELTLNNETFPILEMKSGRKVIIDVGDQLPARIEKLIESNWKNYKILNIRKDEGTESIFNKLSPLSGYYSIIRGDKPLILKGKITIKVWADWIIFKDKESFIKNRGYAVNFIGKKDKEVPLAIKDYIERFGMRVIDISLAEKEDHRQDQKKGSISGEEEIIILNSSTNNELIHALLTLIDQPFTAGAKLPLLSKGNSGFQLGITADIFLKREVRDCIISLQKLPHDMVEILTENKLRILEVQKEETPESVISKVLDFLGIEFSFPTFEFDIAGKGDPHNIAIAIPGFLFQGNDLSKILLTKANVDKNIASFLREKGIKAVRY
ncbi:MAG: LysM peptidoglycan-binding domain-containing protein [Desulfobacterales bacterium]|nr:LysM peptidoglycan-binding domain-containing protein [Desulfobacterales bacterium]